MPASGAVLWQQFDAANFPVDNEVNWPAQPFSIAIPNRVMREASSVADLDCFLIIGEAWAQTVARFLPANPLVMDIGCGCGKLARFLYLNPTLRYIGVDLFRPAIEWCQREFASLAGDRFHFEHFNGISAIYNPAGIVSATDYRLPAPDQTVDVVVCASLFTHLFEPECKHYLAEISRVLRPAGRAIVSIHNQPSAGERFVGDSRRIDIDESYFYELAKEAGLRLKQQLGPLYGQCALLLERA
jgi:SAM-dependent methyltransferase